ncbi:MAG TPA: hypothetical protein VFT67_15290, partial [Jatrophihabitantaceae bacterium]|nr:hypothetical protein [Jatrophihabitantaceae bacterium]
MFRDDDELAAMLSQLAENAPAPPALPSLMRRARRRRSLLVSGVAVGALAASGVAIAGVTKALSQRPADSVAVITAPSESATATSYP